MQVITIPSGMLEANAYTAHRSRERGVRPRRPAPCADGRLWEEAVRRKNSIRYILLTHGHIDHIAGVQRHSGYHRGQGGHPPGRRGLLAKQLGQSGRTDRGFPSKIIRIFQPDLLLEDGACLPFGPKND